MVNREQVIRNIAVILKNNPEKVAQLEKAQAITAHLTSDDGCAIECELYNGNIARYILYGTRSKVTFTVDMATKRLTRKPRNEKPWFADWDNGYHMGDIIRRYHEMRREGK